MLPKTVPAGFGKENELRGEVSTTNEAL